MLRQSRIACVEADLGALEASAERAAEALAGFAPSEGFDGAERGAWRAAALWKPFPIDGMRVVLAATTLVAIAALAAIGALAAISL